jgi:hypothetical protein
VPLPAVAAALAEAQRVRDARFAELDAAIRAEHDRATPRAANAEDRRRWRRNAKAKRNALAREAHA